MKSSGPQQHKIALTRSARVCTLLLPMVDKTVPHPIFAEQVQRAAARTGLGVGDIAKALGVTPEMARRYREGLAMPRPGKMEKLARLLGLSPGQLQFGEITEASSAAGLFSGVDHLGVDEKLLLDAYRQLPEFGKKAVRARATELLEHFGPPSKKNPFGKGGTQ